VIALTFSNKAADEMRERVARVQPVAAEHIWIGTFHAFGLELLRRYGTTIGLPPKLRVLDPTECLFFLEQALPELNLDYYQNLYEPTVALRDVLRAIERAKDELVDPPRYAALAERMAAAATPDEERGRAAKAAEVARVYAHYQEYLDREHLLDFGDLIVKAVALLRENSNARDDVRSIYAHILVDAYQDVNRASAVLLRELTPHGAGLWAVADVRQSIYRFRGAAPDNVRRFTSDFQGASSDSLEVNYRSQPAIVDVFADLAPHMKATLGGDFAPWQVRREDVNGGVFFHVADDLVAEAEGIAREIQRNHDDGVAYLDQAVLCRSHGHLARIASVLEREGVPMLYLGDLFERPEIRDLLALLSLACHGDGRALVRVARFDEYNIPLVDVRRLRTLAKESKAPFPRALAIARNEPSITEQGRMGIALLEQHLTDLCYGVNAWGLLTRYLFVRSDYLRPILVNSSVSGQQQRIAIYQFLQFAYEQRGGSVGEGEDPKRAFLRHVRRLEEFGEEKQLRDVPECARGVDAVRLLTVHASKGLEFPVVYVPTLGQGVFPAKRKGQPCPPPDGMVEDAGGDGHEEEEECLLFVALSRARDRLYLSRARSYGKQRSHPSRLLDTIVSRLPCHPDGDVTWPRSDPPVPTIAPFSTTPSDEPPVYSVKDLDLYIKCPRLYYYERVLNLGGRRDDSGYVQFQNCVYKVLRWLAEERAEGHSVEDASVLQRLAEIWAKHGPTEHAYETLYFRQAEEIVIKELRGRSRTRRLVELPVWEVPLPHGLVQLSPDQVEIRDDGTTVYRRLRTGRVSKSEKDKNIYALYQAASTRQQVTGRQEIHIASLSADTTTPISLGAQALNTRLERYDAAIAGIVAGHFPPEQDEHDCPRCPHYFICPMAEDI